MNKSIYFYLCSAQPGPCTRLTSKNQNGPDNVTAEVSMRRLMFQKMTLYPDSLHLTNMVIVDMTLDVNLNLINIDGMDDFF